MSDDRTFLERCNAGDIAKDEWTHEAHLRLAYMRLRDHPLDRTLRLLRETILGLNRRHGVEETPTAGYHETLTVAWAHLVAAALQQAGPDESFASFLESHPHLAFEDTIHRYYSMGALFSVNARRGFVAPDLEPLPVIDPLGMASEIEGSRGRLRDGWRRRSRVATPALQAG